MGMSGCAGAMIGMTIQYAGAMIGMIPRVGVINGAMIGMRIPRVGVIIPGGMGVLTGGAGGEDAAPVISRAKAVGSRECWALLVPPSPYRYIRNILYGHYSNSFFLFCFGSSVLGLVDGGLLGYVGVCRRLFFLTSGIGRALLCSLYL